MTTLTSAQRRAILANAHATYMAKSESLPALVLETSLKEGGAITEDAFLIEVTMDGTIICCHFEDEIVELDAYGNTLKGSK